MRINKKYPLTSEEAFKHKKVSNIVYYNGKSYTKVYSCKAK